MAATDERVLRWSEHGLVPEPDAPAGALLAADSWLVADGAVRALDAHWERFGGWCAEIGLASTDRAGFRAAVTATLPRDRGRWFPRVEAVAHERSARVDAPDLRLRLRPAPARARTARVVLGEPGDPRE